MCCQYREGRYELPGPLLQGGGLGRDGEGRGVVRCGGFAGVADDGREIGQERREAVDPDPVLVTLAGGFRFCPCGALRRGDGVAGGLGDWVLIGEAVLVTSTDYEVRTLAQLYRDRADAENNFYELKNQWGWGGFTTHDLKRCRLMAAMVALVYNWWNLFVRLAPS